MKGSPEGKTKKQIYVIDSFGWIEYYSGGRLSDKYAKHVEKVDRSTHITPALVMYEVYKKISSAFGEEEALKAVIHIQAKTTVVDIDPVLAVESADIGISEKLPMADALIYGTAMRAGAKLVTSDEHFKGKKDVIFIK
jgi:predicted nucleic acid-binding protein